MQHRLTSGDRGLEGRLLKDGEPDSRLAKRAANLWKRRALNSSPWGNRIRALPGPEYHEVRSRLAGCILAFALQSAASNRMGYRLQGQILKRTTDRELLSHGLLPGVVQVPHNGSPLC